MIPLLSSIKISFALPGDDGVQHTLLNGRDIEKEIRGMEVSNSVSKIAEIPEVRHRLVELQQQYGIEKGIVMDGRDIGTTVFPHAELKVFVNASPEVRAMRRLKELKEKGENPSFDEVLENIRTRDHIDSTRSESPLRKASDARLLDNDKLSREEQMQLLLLWVKETVSE